MNRKHTDDDTAHHLAFDNLDAFRRYLRVVERPIADLKIQSNDEVLKVMKNSIVHVRMRVRYEANSCLLRARFSRTIELREE